MAETSGNTNRSVLFFTDDWWACAWYRCYVPGVQLKKLGYDVVLDTTIKPQDIERFEVIVFQRKADHNAYMAIEAAKAAGRMTVYELDDDIFSISASNPGAVVWKQPAALAGAKECIAACDLVTTSSHVLAEKLRLYNPNVLVLPNSLPPDLWQYPEPKKQSAERVVLGWAGSTSHIEDFNIISEVVPQLLERYPQVEFEFAGGPVNADIALGERVRRLETTDIQNYNALLERFDLGMIPLVDTAFNRAKSDLKFVEYSMIGIPTVASKVEPYSKSVKHGENGFLAANPKDWLKFLGRLIESPELRLEIATRAQEFARTRTIDKTIDKWVRAYKLAEPPAAD